MSSSKGRRINALEKKLHQVALAAGKPLTQKEMDALESDASKRIEAINFLSAAGMLKVMKDPKGTLLYRAVQKGEMDLKKGMSGEEDMVLSHIQAAGNLGIWTKHLKAKTELHQTVIDRCLKSLTQKQIIKPFTGAVKYPTRKLYMMAHLEPSVELTGGPWYTDGELDTEFIKLLCSACLRFIRDRSFPKQKRSEDMPESSQPLFSISNSPSYPSSQHVLSFLEKSRITETQLTEAHVESLLNVLVLDGDVEKLPAFGAALWEANADDGSGAESETDSDSDSDKKKRKRSSKAGSSSSSKKRKSSKVKIKTSDDDASGETDDEAISTPKKSRSKSKSRSDEKGKGKKRKRKDVSDDDEDSGSESESDGGKKSRSKSKKKSKKRKIEESGSEDGESDEDLDKGKKKKKAKSETKSRSKSKSKSLASSSESGSESGSDSESHKRSRSRSRSKSRFKSTSKKPKSKSRARSSSPVASETSEVDAFTGSAYVYRAVRQERVALGWSQAPCGRCPVFEFCKDRGPTNPRDCAYYGEWLGRGTVAAE